MLTRCPVRFSTAGLLGRHDTGTSVRCRPTVSSCRWSLSSNEAHRTSHAVHDSRGRGSTANASSGPVPGVVVFRPVRSCAWAGAWYRAGRDRFVAVAVVTRSVRAVTVR
ncbi:hypothetical protein SAMN05216371_0252 [Streptomyces sp. TLI_053]|nr:hypothetical protein SAMN05216371_0252 [Streptomyces sp. TLI_053]